MIEFYFIVVLVYLALLLCLNHVLKVHGIGLSDMGLSTMIVFSFVPGLNVLIAAMIFVAYLYFAIFYYAIDD